MVSFGARPYREAFHLGHRREEVSNRARGCEPDAIGGVIQYFASLTQLFLTLVSYAIMFSLVGCLFALH